LAYSELIKSFAKIRDYISRFYVYGFRSRKEFDGKSERSYDNERRRIESWLGEYMYFTQGSDGRRTFLSVDSRRIAHDPLYKAFKAKSFTDRDIMLHFYILDILAEGEALSSAEISDIIVSDYLSEFDSSLACDESTVRKKLNEYERAGLLTAKKEGRRKLYSVSVDETDLSELYDALLFFSEADPLGVVGSYLLDKYDRDEDIFRFKQHYIMNTLESEVLYDLLLAIEGGVQCEAQMFSVRQKRVMAFAFVPMKIYVSTYNGRRYVLGASGEKIVFYRLDRIKSVRLLDGVVDTEKCREQMQSAEKHLWGVSASDIDRTDRIEMTVRAGEGEEHIVSRLMREKRGGEVKELGGGLWRFSAEVFDAAEMIPWIRTFTGRIAELRCTNEYVTDTIKSDLEEMYRMYGTDGDGDDI